MWTTYWARGGDQKQEKKKKGLGRARTTDCIGRVWGAVWKERHKKRDRRQKTVDSKEWHGKGGRPKMGKEHKDNKKNSPHAPPLVSRWVLSFGHKKVFAEEEPKKKRISGQGWSSRGTLRKSKDGEVIHTIATTRLRAHNKLGKKDQRGGSDKAGRKLEKL